MVLSAFNFISDLGNSDTGFIKKKKERQNLVKSYKSKKFSKIVAKWKKEKKKKKEGCGGVELFVFPRNSHTDTTGTLPSYQIRISLSLFSFFFASPIRISDWIRLSFAADTNKQPSIMNPFSSGTRLR